MQLKIYFVLTIVSFNLMHTIQKRSLHFNSALITLRNYPWIFFFVYFSKKILIIFISSCNYEFCTNIKKKKSNIYRLHVNTLFIHSRSNRKRNSSTIQKFANKVRPIFAKKEKGGKRKKLHPRGKVTNSKFPRKLLQTIRVFSFQLELDREVFEIQIEGPIAAFVTHRVRASTLV